LQTDVQQVASRSEYLQSLQTAMLWLFTFRPACLQGLNQLSWVIAANEEMARLLILADAFLAGQDKVRAGQQQAPPCA
jgi:hypothetical protein